MLHGNPLLMRSKKADAFQFGPLGVHFDASVQSSVILEPATQLVDRWEHLGSYAGVTDMLPVGNKATRLPAQYNGLDAVRVNNTDMDCQNVNFQSDGIGYGLVVFVGTVESQAIFSNNGTPGGGFRIYYFGGTTRIHLNLVIDVGALHGVTQGSLNLYAIRCGTYGTSGNNYWLNGVKHNSGNTVPFVLLNDGDLRFDGRGNICEFRTYTNTLVAPDPATEWLPEHEAFYDSQVDAINDELLAKWGIPHG